MAKDSKRGPVQILGDIKETERLLLSEQRAYAGAAASVLSSGCGANDEAFDIFTNIKAYKTALIEYKLELAGLET